MLTTKQIIAARCDILHCVSVDISEEEIPPFGMPYIPILPKGWFEVGPLTICPRHTNVTLKVEVGEITIIEDNS